jgi:hypothetical protein
MEGAQDMSSDTPNAGDWWCPQCKEALPGIRVTYSERCDTCGTPVTVAGEGDVARLERELSTLTAQLAAANARLAQVERAAQAFCDSFTEHADRCRPCAIAWQTLRNLLKGESA